jgi:UDP-N-acetylmuramyl pentapeptide synthase
MTVKSIGKSFLTRRLEKRVRQLRAKNDFTIIAVVGSVGKTSTKLAIGKTLQHSRKVIFQEGNYNDRLTVPLVFFDKPQPAIFDVLAWIKILSSIRREVRQPYLYDYVVLELGTDGPGQLQAFAYLQPEILVVTAVADEHMEFFKTLEAVAAEEMTPLAFSKKVFINVDDVAERYINQLDYLGYGTHEDADYRLTSTDQQNLSSQTLEISHEDAQLTLQSNMLGLQGAKAVLAAAAVAIELGVEEADIQAGLKDIHPFAGRLQVLQGVAGATIIDDTYNASPIAVKAALDVLYAAPAKRRIAILGTMNELGEHSEAAHRDIGAFCDSHKVDLVVTIGENAEKFLAPAAREAGCEVLSFTSPYDAGRAVKAKLAAETVVLAKGSQNGVFAEEAVKQLLADPADSSKLVRQSPYWLAVKKQQFPKQ